MSTYTRALLIFFIFMQSACNRLTNKEAIIAAKNHLYIVQHEHEVIQPFIKIVSDSNRHVMMSRTNRGALRQLGDYYIEGDRIGRLIENVPSNVQSSIQNFVDIISDNESIFYTPNKKIYNTCGRRLSYFFYYKSMNTNCVPCDSLLMNQSLEDICKVHCSLENNWVIAF
ncbi:hypothetical protein WAF17_05705 [Bernardetia sp. ABR2-2B]|uniref:hypothetical protein n=1 Tax=Bernardetia sp. ABR2-2B TaxID=3127472 RepID=UPI0030D1C3AB